MGLYEVPLSMSLLGFGMKTMFTLDLGSFKIAEFPDGVHWSAP